MLAILLQAFLPLDAGNHRHIRLRTDRRSQAGADHRMIIDYQNSNGHV